MTDPKRLIDDELTSHFENTLIHAGRGEVLDAGHRSRLFSGLGLVALAPLSAAALTGALQSGVQPLQAGAQALAGGSSLAAGGVSTSAQALANPSLAQLSLSKLTALKSAVGLSATGLKGLLGVVGLLGAAGLVGAFGGFDTLSQSRFLSRTPVQVAVTGPAVVIDPVSQDVQAPLQQGQPGADNDVIANPAVENASENAAADNVAADNVAADNGAAEAQFGVSAPKSVSPRRDTAEASPLTRELQLVDAARQALLRSEPRTTLARLDAYRTQFPKGTLRSEALMLRVEALVALGDRASARRVAEQLLRRTPNSPYSRRIHSLLGE